MRLDRSILQLMARGTLVGAFTLGAAGCPDTSQQAPPSSHPHGQTPDGQTPDGTPAGQTPDGQTPDGPDAQAPNGQAPTTSPSATPECGGVHENGNMMCPHCDYCPPCGMG